MQKKESLAEQNEPKTPDLENPVSGDNIGNLQDSKESFQSLVENAVIILRDIFVLISVITQKAMNIYRFVSIMQFRQK